MMVFTQQVANKITLLLSLCTQVILWIPNSNFSRAIWICWEPWAAILRKSNGIMICVWEQKIWNKVTFWRSELQSWGKGLVQVIEESTEIPSCLLKLSLWHQAQQKSLQFAGMATSQGQCLGHYSVNSEVSNTKFLGGWLCCLHLLSVQISDAETESSWFCKDHSTTVTRYVIMVRFKWWQQWKTIPSP